ncbi:MAG: hypothetical protein LUH14_03635 [Clostridiaceae bacterium]|nr:hypothetical protein [Clostridiaceae bacterium]
MTEQNLQKKQVHRERQAISRHAGLLFGRCALLICLFFLFIPLRPTSSYIFAFAVLFPWIYGNILDTKSPADNTLILSCSAKRFFYTPNRFRAEKLTKNCMIFFLAVWQVVLNRQPTNYPVWSQLAPAFCLLLYLLCMITSTIIIRRKIHKYYTELLFLK